MHISFPITRYRKNVNTVHTPTRTHVTYEHTCENKVMYYPLNVTNVVKVLNGSNSMLDIRDPKTKHFFVNFLLNNNNNNDLFPSLVQENTTVYVNVCSTSNMYFTSFNKFTINYTSVLTLLQYAYSPRACLI